MSDVTVSISLTKKEQGALYMAHLDAKKTIKKLIGQRDELLGALQVFADIQIDCATEIVPNGYSNPEQWRQHVLAARAAIAKATA